MKDKDEEGETDFMTVNLCNVIKQQNPESIFRKEDLRNVKVIDRDEVKRSLEKLSKDVKKPKDAINFIKIVGFKNG